MTNLVLFIFFGIGAGIHTNQQIQCLPYVELLDTDPWQNHWSVFGLTEIDREIDREIDGGKVLTPEIDREIDRGKVLTPKIDSEFDRDKGGVQKN